MDGAGRSSGGRRSFPDTARGTTRAPDDAGSEAESRGRRRRAADGCAGERGQTAEVTASWQHDGEREPCGRRRWRRGECDQGQRQREREGGVVGEGELLSSTAMARRGTRRRGADGGELA